MMRNSVLQVHRSPSAQSKERQDCQDHNDCTDKPDDVVHEDCLRNGIDLMPTVKVKVRSLSLPTQLVGGAVRQIDSSHLARGRNLPSAHVGTGLVGKALG